MKGKSSIDEMLPFGKMSMLSIQHVLAFYSGGVAIPLIVGAGLGLSPQEIGILIAADLFTCGIATIIQSLGIGKHIGIRLPVILGCAFAPIAVIISTGNNFGITTVYGSIIVAGVFIFLIAPLFGKILKLFPPVVTGSVVCIIGLSLIPNSITDIAGGSQVVGTELYGAPQFLFLTGITLLIVVIINRFTKGFMKSISILLGLIIGTVIAATMGLVDPTPLIEASWFQFVRPFHFGLPTFEPQAIISMCIVMLIVMIESTGTFFVIGNYVGKEIGEKEVTKGLRAEGIATVLGGVFNSFPYTTYSGNAGLVGLTRINSRFVVVLAGVFLFILGLLPKFAALATMIPRPVLGAVMLIMFSMIVTSGIEMLQKVNLKKQGNVFVIAISIGAGLGVTFHPEVFQHAPDMVKMLVENGIVVGSVIAVILNLIMNGFNKIDDIDDIEDDTVVTGRTMTE